MRLKAKGRVCVWGKGSPSRYGDCSSEGSYEARLGTPGWD